MYCFGVYLGPARFCNILQGCDGSSRKGGCWGVFSKVAYFAPNARLICNKIKGNLIRLRQTRYTEYVE